MIPLEMDEDMRKDLASIAGDFDTVAKNQYWGIWKRRSASSVSP